MNATGMDEVAIREAVQQRFQIGKKYMLKSEKSETVCQGTLISFSAHVATFRMENGFSESYKYSELLYDYSV